MAKSWKDLLLASGLPFEHEVRRCLERYGCVARFDYSYFRPNEHRLQKEFSYDIDASLIESPHFVDLMVECKYRNPAVKWVFAPDNYGGMDEAYENAFLHPFDHFVSRTFPFTTMFPRQIGPPCSKGIEMRPDGPHEGGIIEACSQLAFAFGSKIADAIEHQVLGLLGREEFIFYHVPVIVTTAPMFRLRDDVSVAAIAKASQIEEISTQESIVVLKYQASLELRDHTRDVLAGVSIEREVLTKTLSSYTKDLDFLLSNLASGSPQAIVVLTVADGWDVFERFFAYVREIVNPSEALIAEIKEGDAKRKARFDALLANRKSKPDSAVDI